MKRRKFLASTASASTLLLGGSVLAPAAASAQASLATGADLTGWRTVIGDGVWVGPGQSEVTLDDIRTQNLGTHSLLEANIHERGVMAHNITFDRFSAPDGMTKTHTAEAEFRIPTVPTTDNWDYNAQTLEIGVFVWDGETTRSDYGVAIQWVLNPWIAEFGDIRAWAMTANGPEWQTVGYLEPDTEWHSFRCQYRPGAVANIRIDNDNIDVAETVTEKSPTWGNTIDGRFQLEIVSVWPGQNPTVPAHSAEFRNWAWRVTS